MSIENNLKRIADSLESIAKSMEMKAKPPMTASAIALQSEQTLAPIVAVDPAPTEVNSQVAPPTTAAAAATINPPATMSAEEMNTALVAEFSRLGSREPIDTAMATLGVTSVADLAADQQQALLTAVRAIPA